MNAQIIHQSKSPLVIEWLRGIHRERAERAEAVHSLAHDLSETYGEAADGHRPLSVQSGFVGGFGPNYAEEPTPDGWLRSSVWGGFVPDADTEVGRSWQSRIDNMPSLDGSFDCTVVGIPTAIGVSINDGEVTLIHPSFSMNDEQDSVYVTWSDRGLLPALETAMATMDPNGSHGWSALPRSAWYALIELSEANAILAASQGH